MKLQAPIELESINHSFDNKTVLAGITFAFEVNQVTAVLGKSGSGKTTLLQIINGMTIPGGGVAKLFGKPIPYDSIQDLRLEVGYVVQQVGLFPHLTIQGNICLLGKIRKISKEAMNTRMYHLMDMVGLPSTFRKKYPHQLSGGEQQRVGLCRAMFLNPPVLLMDEPFGSLDYETKNSIYGHILTIQQYEPRTLVLVTHDWEEATTLADRFIWLKNGVIKTTGDKVALEKLKLTYLTDL